MAGLLILKLCQVMGWLSLRIPTATEILLFITLSLLISATVFINNCLIQLKRTHSYYYQVQMAMVCTNTRWCDFLLRTTVDYHCERVEYNETFCLEIIPILRRFYIITILPEISLEDKSIWEPKDWISDEESFIQEMEQLVS